MKSPDLLGHGVGESPELTPGAAAAELAPGVATSFLASSGFFPCNLAFVRKASTALLALPSRCLSCSTFSTSSAVLSLAFSRAGLFLVCSPPLAPGLHLGARGAPAPASASGLCLPAGSVRSEISPASSLRPEAWRQDAPGFQPGAFCRHWKLR